MDTNMDNEKYYILSNPIWTNFDISYILDFRKKNENKILCYLLYKTLLFRSVWGYQNICFASTWSSTSKIWRFWEAILAVFLMKVLLSVDMHLDAELLPKPNLWSFRLLQKLATAVKRTRTQSSKYGIMQWKNETSFKDHWWCWIRVAYHTDVPFMALELSECCCIHFLQ